MGDTSSWYEFVQGEELRQGDLLCGCPFTALSPDVDLAAIRTDAASVGAWVSTTFWDSVILTQSCDLVSDTKRVIKTDAVLMCPYRPLSKADELLSEAARNNEKSRANFFDQVRRGYQPNLHMIDAPPSETAEKSEILLLDFRRVFTCPSALTQRIARDSQQRLRLRSPYVEHLSQAFARFFMRVGLPSDIPPFRAKSL